MRLVILLFIPVVFFISLSGYGQTTIAKQNFDSNNSWSFSSNVTFFSHDSNSGINEYPDPVSWTSDGFYGEINLSDTNNKFSSTGFSGGIIGASDLDDEGDFGASNATLTFAQQSVTGFNDVEISFDYETVGFDGSDELEYRLIEDGAVGTFVALPKNSPGGGTKTINVNATNNVELEIKITQDGANDYVGVDNILLTGTPINDSDSDIITTTFAPTDNIDCNSYTATNSLTTTNAIKIGEFKIRDGGASGDSDGVGTILTDIDFDVTNSDNLAAIAFFDGTTNVAEVTTVTATTSFTSINSGNGLTAPDDGSKVFDVYATFQTLITDNEQIQLSVSSATADVVNGSVFNTTNAGGASTPVSGDDNRIEVTATNLSFTVQPTNNVVNTVMNPAVEIAAQDANSNTDKDFNNAISVTTTGSFDASATTTETPANGVATFSNLIFDSNGSALTIQGSATGVSPTGNSNTFTVDDLDVNFDDFDDGDFTNNPTWSGSTTGFSVISYATVPNGNAFTDGSFLASNSGEGEISLATQSSEVSEWQFSLASPDFNPSNTNFIGVVLMANSSFSGDVESNNFQGYYLRIGENGSDDSIVLFRKTGSDKEKVGIFPSAPTLGIGALKDGLNIRVTRNASGTFELFYSTGFQYNSIPTQSAGTLTNNTYSTSSYFGVFQNISSTDADRRVYLDNISLGDSSIDSNTDVIPPASQVDAGTITADVATNATNSVKMFRFTVDDQGTFDGLATEISQFRLVPGSNNTADWSETIQGVRVVADVTDGLVAQSDQNVSVNDNEIIVDITGTPDNEMTVADGSSIDYTISVFLNESNIKDNDIIQLAIPETSSDWTTGMNSSGFNPIFTGFEGNNFTINVVGNGLEFVSDVSDTNINEAMTTVQVANTDSNGNADRDLTDAIEITSTGTLTGGSVNVIPVEGVATFSGLMHTELGTGLTLTASTTAAGLGDITSSAFDIRKRPELMISEITDPADHADNSKIRYVELFNAGVDAIDFSTEKYYLHNATTGSSVQLTGSIDAKEYYIIALNSADFNTEYGLSADLQSGIINLNGDDAVYLSTQDTKASLFDIYGVIADSDMSGNPWDYPDTRAYRTIPATSQSNTTYTSSEWTIDPSPTNGSGMNPNEGENDYIYVDDISTWTAEGSGSNPDGNGTTTENLFVEAGTATLSLATTVNDVTVKSGATLIIEDLLTIDGDFISNGTTIFRSTATKTAALNEVPTNTRVRGSGFQAERYVPATSRSFRYLSSSVNTPGTINDNWQEGATTASSNQNPNPGYGTHITGGSPADGFDATSTSNPSLFQWNEGTQVWDTKTSTNDPATDQLVAGDAYAMLIRGDRNAPLNSNTAIGDPTTLRATGTIVTGDVEVGVDVGDLAAYDTQNETYSLIGNPYQAQVNMELLLNASSGLNQNFIYIYDPNITDNGGYATVDMSDPNNVTVDPTTSNANELLQANQAFFVQTTAANPTLTFTESIKSTETANVGTFSNTNTTANQFISINFYDDAEQELKDGVRVKFSSDYSNQVNNADAPKLWNDLEWFSLVNNANYMAIESRALPKQNDTINLYTGNYQSANYHFEIDVHEMDYADVQLYDAYQDTHTDLSSGQNSIAFGVDASIPESIAGNRFQLVFDQVTLGIEDQPEATSLQVYPNPVINKQLHICGLPGFSASSEVELQLYNMLGQKVYQESISGLKQDQEINLPELTAGNYLLQLTNGEQTQNKHLLVK